MNGTTRMNRALALVPLLALLAGCVSATGGLGTSPADLARLEAAATRGTTSGDTLTLLGAAYVQAERPEDALAALERALATHDAPATAHANKGLAHEALEQWQSARDAYTAYLAAETADGDLRADIERRLLLAEREATAAEARRLVRYEAALSEREPEPRSVAVFPFNVVSDDPRYAPLEVALADMVTTDLAIPGVLTLLERSRIQAVLREMALSLGGYTAPESGARVGRLMRAENVVQGSVVLLPDERVRIAAAVVDAERAQPQGTVADEAALDRIFDAEKALVLRLLDVLGVTPTAAEIERIQSNRTDNLLAFLAYGEGLLAMDRGDFDAARADFARAAGLDPSFAPAQLRSSQAQQLSRARQTPPARVARAASGAARRRGRPSVGGNLADRMVRAAVSSRADRMLRGHRRGAIAAALGARNGRDTGYEDREGEVAGGGTVIRITIPNPTQP